MANDHLSKANGGEAESKIVVRSLYKIFGDDPQRALPLVLDGIGKEELLEKHNHVLGLADINLEVEQGELFVVMGLSGSGKSTLIRHFNRLIEPTSGSIVVDGDDVVSFSKSQLEQFRREKMSMVFQRFGLFPHRTVVENVGYGLEVQRQPKEAIREQAVKWIDRVGLKGFEDHFPGQLSGGMQQRVGLARALATDAEVMLMDEAFSALDPLIRTDMQDLLLELQQQLHKTIIFITHDLDEALKLGHHIAILKDGLVVQSGDPQEIILNPADPYIEDFVRDINRARVIRARSVMTAPDGAPSGLPTVSVGDNLEAVLAKIDGNPEATVLVEREGSVVGQLSARTVLETLRPVS